MGGALVLMGPFWKKSLEGCPHAPSQYGKPCEVGENIFGHDHWLYVKIGKHKIAKLQRKGVFVGIVVIVRWNNKYGDDKGR